MSRLVAWWSERVPVTAEQLRELTNEPVPNHMKRWWFAARRHASLSVCRADRDRHHASHLLPAGFYDCI